MNIHKVMDMAKRDKRSQDKINKKPRDLGHKKVHSNKRRNFSDNPGRKH